jgi:hypothetical protein
VASFAIVLAARSSDAVKPERAIADAALVEASNGTAQDASEDMASSATAGSAMAGSATGSGAMAGSAAESGPRDSETTILEVRTRPEGATVRVAGKQQVAPARFVLPAGRYAIDAEANGWMPERRSVELVEGVRLVQDILFTTRLHGPRKPRTGKLTVRTTPPCEVFLDGKRLAETPFADLELEPATYALVFKHPKRAAVTKRVKITAGKTTRLSFTLR